MEIDVSARQHDRWDVRGRATMVGQRACPEVVAHRRKNLGGAPEALKQEAKVIHCPRVSVSFYPSPSGDLFPPKIRSILACGRAVCADTISKPVPFPERCRVAGGESIPLRWRCLRSQRFQWVAEEGKIQLSVFRSAGKKVPRSRTSTRPATHSAGSSRWRCLRRTEICMNRSSVQGTRSGGGDGDPLRQTGVNRCYRFLSPVPRKERPLPQSKMAQGSRRSSARFGYLFTQRHSWLRFLVRRGL
jgi:hypothetical protein